MTQRNLNKERLFLSFLIVSLLIGGIVAATVVGPNGIYDTDYLNGTTIYANSLFLGDVNYTASIIAGGGSGWDGTGALFQNGTRELTDNWEAGTYNISAANFTAADFYLESVGNLTAYIDSEIAAVPTGTAGTGNLNVSGWDYLIEYVNGNLNIWNATGQIQYTSAVDNYTIIQEMFNSTTQRANGDEVWGYDEPNQKHIKEKRSWAIWLGPYEIDIGVGNQILIPNHVTFATDGGAITGTPGANPLITNMWSNFTYDVKINGLRIESKSGAGDTGIKWYVQNATYPTGDGARWMLEVTDLYFRGFTYLMHVESVGGISPLIMMDNVRSGSGTLRIYRVFDAIITDIEASSYDFRNIVTCYLEGLYGGSGGITISGGTEAYPVKGNILVGIRNDNTWAGHGVTITGWFTENSLVAWHFANQRDNGGANDNLYDALVFAGNCSFNTVTTSFFGNYPSRTNIDTWRHAVNFSSVSHNNTLLGNTYAFDQIDSEVIYESGGPLYDNNIENRRRTYNGNSLGLLNDATKHYLIPTTAQITTGTHQNRAVLLNEAGWFADWEVMLDLTPGADNAYVFNVTIATTAGGISGGTVDFGVNITDAETYEATTNAYYHDPGSVPDFWAITYTPLGTPSQRRAFWTVDFYPDLESYMLGPRP